MAHYKGGSGITCLVGAMLCFLVIQARCGEAAEIDPEYAAAYNNQGVLKANLKDHRGAIRDYTRAIELDPNYAYAYVNRGNSKGYLGDYRGAIADYTKAIRLDPKYATGYSNRGAVRLRLGEYQGAVIDCTKAIKLNPKYAMAYRKRGIAKLHLGDDHGAIQDYTRAIELDPEDDISYSNRGVAKSHLGYYQGAIADYTKAIELDPKDDISYSNRGVAKLHLGDNQGAIQDWPGRTAGEMGSKDAWNLIKSFSSNDQEALRRRTTYVAPSRAMEEFVITNFDYDDATKKGKISVRTYGRGMDCREWLVKNIGAICSSKNITLRAGSESKKGGRYRILDEKIEEDILTVHFESAW